MINTFQSKKNLLYKVLFSSYILSFWVFLFWSDFPLPHGDDLFFAGTAVHYADTGEFENPGVYEYTAHFSEIRKPYWFVPLHMRSLGWWIGITDASDHWIRIYVLVCVAITTIFLILWAQKKCDKPFIFLWTLPIIVAFGFRWSLRPECTAIPLLIIGAFVLSLEPTRKSTWVGISFLGLSSLASQIMVIPSACLIIGHFWIFLRKSSWKEPCLQITIGAVQTLCIGICLINFEIDKFLTMFFDHVNSRSSSVSENLSFLYFMSCKLGNGYLLRLPSFLILIFLCISMLRSERKNKPLIISLIASILSISMVYAKSFELILFLVTLSTILILFTSRRLQIPFTLMLTLLLFVRQGTHLLAYDMFCDRKKNFGAISIKEEQTYVIDEYVIRHPLDWKFPKKWKIAPDFYTTNDRLLNKPDSETWLISLKNLSYFYPDIYQQSKLTIGNKEFTNLPQEYWEYKLLP